jgi:hypothetical protein
MCDIFLEEFERILIKFEHPQEIKQTTKDISSSFLFLLNLAPCSLQKPFFTESLDDTYKKILSLPKIGIGFLPQYNKKEKDNAPEKVLKTFRQKNFMALVLFCVIDELLGLRLFNIKGDNLKQVFCINYHLLKLVYHMVQQDPIIFQRFLQDIRGNQKITQMIKKIRVNSFNYIQIYQDERTYFRTIVHDMCNNLQEMLNWAYTNTTTTSSTNEIENGIEIGIQNGIGIENGIQIENVKKKKGKQNKVNKKKKNKQNNTCKFQFEIESSSDSDDHTFTKTDIHVNPSDIHEKSSDHSSDIHMDSDVPSDLDSSDINMNSDNFMISAVNSSDVQSDIHMKSDVPLDLDSSDIHMDSSDIHMDSDVKSSDVHDSSDVHVKHILEPYELIDESFYDEQIPMRDVFGCVKNLDI